MNTSNSKTHSSKEIAEFSFENVDVKSISRVSDQNGVSLLYIVLGIHHTGWEPLLLQSEDEKQTVTFFRVCRNEAL